MYLTMKITRMALASDLTGSDSVTGVRCHKKADTLLFSPKSLRVYKGGQTFSLSLRLCEESPA